MLYRNNVRSQTEHENAELCLLIKKKKEDGGGGGGGLEG